MPTTPPVTVRCRLANRLATPKSLELDDAGAVASGQGGGRVRLGDDAGRFDGLRSRWTTPRSWACLRAGASWQAISSTSRQGSRPCAFEHGVEAGAGDVLHGEPGPAVVDAGIEEADDVGVVEMADDFDLALEAQHEARLGGQLGGQHLDGGDGRPVGRRRFGVGEVDGGHAAASDFPVEEPRAESCADHVRRTTGGKEANRRWIQTTRREGVDAS